MLPPRYATNDTHALKGVIRDCNWALGQVCGESTLFKNGMHFPLFFTKIHVK